MITKLSLQDDAGVTYPLGFRASAVAVGIKTSEPDLCMIVCDRNAAAAGVFTTNLVQAACVRHSRKVVRGGQARAIVCNSGNANACNGEAGDRDARLMAERTASLIGTTADEVLVASTGVIGHRMPMDRVLPGLDAAAGALGSGPATDAGVAAAIMTTDLRRKMLRAECRSDTWNEVIRIGAVCKGSGMIAPRMATMLCFVTTDAWLSASLLQEALGLAVRTTFNRVTVDGDTSTNDMVLLLASGAGPVAIREKGPAWLDFVEALTRVCEPLARLIARDGEGATKLVEVRVEGAPQEADAERVARTIAESPLVKTALFGSDPNWGRILAAAGRAGVPFDPEAARVTIGGTEVFAEGAARPFDRQALREYLRGETVEIVVSLGHGPGTATFWTCDLSYDYVRINAEYHT